MSAESPLVWIKNPESKPSQDEVKIPQCLRQDWKVVLSPRPNSVPTTLAVLQAIRNLLALDTPICFLFCWELDKSNFFPKCSDDDSNTHTQLLLSWILLKKRNTHCALYIRASLIKKDKEVAGIVFHTGIQNSCTMASFLHRPLSLIHLVKETKPSSWIRLKGA